MAQLACLILVWVTLDDARRWPALALAAFFPGNVYMAAVFPVSLCALALLCCIRLSWSGMFKRAALAAAAAAACYPTGVLLAPVVGLWALLHRRWRATWVVAGALGGLAAVVLVMRLQTGAWDAFALVQAKYAYSGNLLDYREYTLNWYALPGLSYRNTTVGPMVLPGTYTAKLTVNGQTYTQPIMVVQDPRVSATPAALTAQFELQQRMVAGLTVTYNAFTFIQQLRSTLGTRLNEAAGNLDYVKLSVVAKTYFLLNQRGRPATEVELRNLAKHFGWDVKEEQIFAAAGYLEKLGLTKSREL